ncbi:MAG: hypothetical protein SVX43_08190, partial [Cyanobacteriota bacterium]|nr:hypothetical protein [Cyanobacteriota bacterium]
AMQLLYNPLGSDPVGNNIHWIQRVVNNHAVTSTLNQSIELPHGTPEDKIDVLQEQTNPNFVDPQNPQRLVFNPYYDTYSPLANQVSFADRPGRRDIFDNHDWYAELYLVEEIAPQTVKIYNGISWGWESTFTPTPTQKFTDSLSAGEVDAFNLNDLTPGLNFLAWIDNDLPQNRCNPNTYLNTSFSDGEYYYDNDSSFLGDGFASALTGKVPKSGSLDLFVSSVGSRGEDSGSYDLYVKVYAEGKKPPKPQPKNPENLVLMGGSGGAGAVRPRPGRTQDDPILADSTNGNWQIFQNVPSCRWYDPHTPYGFEFQSLGDTLFTEILDFPVGAGDPFSVWVNNQILGEFRPGDRVDFVSLLGGGISQFLITGIESLVGSTPETAFPIQLAFNESVGSFQMRPFEKGRSVPEPRFWIGGLVLVSMLVFWVLERKLD